MARPSEHPPKQEKSGSTLASLISRAIPAKGGVSAIIAIAGALALILGLVLLLFAQELKGTAYTIMAIGGILLLIALMLSFATVWESITGRRGRYSANTVVMSVAVVALAVLVFAVAERNSQRYDVTSTRQFSLAPQTLDILKGLQEPVEATAFFVPGNVQQEPFRVPAENLLNELKHRSGGKFDYRFIDPDRQPTLASEYQVSRYPSIVFEGKDSSGNTIFQNLSAPPFEESKLASALLIVTGARLKPVYYLEGHGERSLPLNPEDCDRNSHQQFCLAAGGLARDNYVVLPLSLAEAEDPVIPEHAAALIIAGPTKDLEEGEFQAVHDYLKGGGRLLLLLEPDPPDSFKDLLARWAITMNEGTVVDLGSSLAGQSRTPLIRRDQYFTQPPMDAITTLLDQSYFPGVGSLVLSLPPEEMPDYIAHYAIARTTRASCLSLDPEINDCPEGDFNPHFPALAVQAIAALNEEPEPDAPREARIVVFADTDFATNFHLFSQSNSDLLFNSVNWLTEDISLASVRPRPRAFRQLILVVTNREMLVIRGLSWFVLPGVMVALAGVAWWRRR